MIIADKSPKRLIFHQSIFNFMAQCVWIIDFYLVDISVFFRHAKCLIEDNNSGVLNGKEQSLGRGEVWRYQR